MVKVSITLPNNAQITFEAEEPEVIHEIVGMVLRDLPRDLMQATGQANANGEHPPEPVNGKAPKSKDPMPEAPVSLESSPAIAVSPGPVDTEAVPASNRAEVNGQTVAAPAMTSTAAETRFIEFCQTANPLGDMRRVVVAAEGSRQFLNAASVDAEELGRLFNLAGWPGPHSIVQTLRNAARSKFRWLERVPGRSGYYTVTEVGRNIALGS